MIDPITNEVIYELDNKVLKIEYHVYNLDKKTLAKMNADLEARHSAEITEK